MLVETSLHRMLIKNLPSIAEEIDVALTTNKAQVLHDLRTNKVGLLRIGKNTHCFIEVFG